MDFKDKKLDFTKQHIDNAINSMLDIMFNHGVL